MGKIKGKEVSFLGDSGATHNFTNPITANRLGMQSENVGAFEVMMEDGKKIAGGGCCKGAKLSIQDYESNTDLMVVPPNDPQVIFWARCGSRNWVLAGFQ